MSEVILGILPADGEVRFQRIIGYKKSIFPQSGDFLLTNS